MQVAVAFFLETILLSTNSAQFYVIFFISQKYFSLNAVHINTPRRKPGKGLEGICLCFALRQIDYIHIYLSYFSYHVFKLTVYQPRESGCCQSTVITVWIKQEVEIPTYLHYSLLIPFSFQHWILWKGLSPEIHLRNFGIQF